MYLSYPFGYGACAIDTIVSKYYFHNYRKVTIDFFFMQVGSMGAEGYCVNVPWSRGGVGDNDYLFAFQHVVLPIGYYLFSNLNDRRNILHFHVFIL